MKLSELMTNSLLATINQRLDFWETEVLSPQWLDIAIPPTESPFALMQPSEVIEWEVPRALYPAVHIVCAISIQRERDAFEMLNVYVRGTLAEHNIFFPVRRDFDGVLDDLRRTVDAFDYGRLPKKNPDMCTDELVAQLLDVLIAQSSPQLPLTSEALVYSRDGVYMACSHIVPECA